MTMGLATWVVTVFKWIAAFCLVVYVTTRNWAQPDDDVDVEPHDDTRDKR